MSNKIIYSLLYLIYCTLPTAAQNSNYFIKTIHWLDVHSPKGIYQKNDGTFILSANAKYLGSDTWKPYFLELDNQANIVNLAGYTGWLYHTTPGKMYCNDITCLLSAFKLNIDYLGSYSYVLTYQNGQINAYDIPNNNSHNGLHACVPLSGPAINNGFYTGGYYMPEGELRELYLVKLNSNYEMLWDTVYYSIPINTSSGIFYFDFGYNSYFNDMVRGPNNSYFLLATVDDNWDWSADGSVVIMQVNGEGDILWARYYELGADEQTYSLTNTLDGGLLFTAVTDQSLFSSCMGHVVKIDDNGVVEWTWEAPASIPQATGYQHLGYTPQAIQIADSSYIILGHFGISGDSDSDGTIVKLSPAGEFVWQRDYGNAYNDYFYDLIVSDHDLSGRHGYAVCGRTDTIGRADVYFLKLNCMGLLTEPQAEFDTQTEADYTVSFFNQSMYTYPDSIDGGHYRWDFGDGSPPYTCGQGYAPCPAVVQHTYAQAGTYTAQLTAIVCSDTAQVTQTVAASAVGMPASVGQEGGIKVYPNPASESLSLRYNGTQTAQWVLYDMSGRLLKSRDLNGQDRSTQIISVSDLPVGLYYYILHSPNDPSTNQYGKLSIVR